jgi:cytochrome b pre-mRNA-processing protein 3
MGSAAVVSWLSRRAVRNRAAERAFAGVVAQARQAVFYAEFGVPDTVDGRFELLCLHAFLYLHRLKRERPRAQPLAQAFFDRMFADLDRALREMGVGDLSVGRHVMRMAEGFYGRVRAYEAGLAGSDGELQAALARNLYGTAPSGAAPPLARVAGYVRDQAAALDAQPAAALLAGDIVFAAPARLQAA